MGVLLLIACEVACVSPNQVQQPEGNVGRTVARVELGAGRKINGGGGEDKYKRVVSLLFQMLLVTSCTCLLFPYYRYTAHCHP